MNFSFHIPFEKLFGSYFGIHEMRIPSVLERNNFVLLQFPLHCLTKLLRQQFSMLRHLSFHDNLTTIDQINRKPRFSNDWNSEQLSCGLLSEPGACLLDAFSFDDVSRKANKKFFFLYWIKVCKKSQLKVSSSWEWKCRDDHKGSQRQLEPRVVVGGTKENAMG